LVLGFRLELRQNLEAIRRIIPNSKSEQRDRLKKYATKKGTSIKRAGTHYNNEGIGLLDIRTRGWQEKLAVKGI